MKRKITVIRRVSREGKMMLETEDRTVLLRDMMRNLAWKEIKEGNTS